MQPGATWYYSCRTTLEQPGDYSGTATAGATDAETSQAAPTATATWTLSARCGRVVTGTVEGDQTALPGSTCLVGADLAGNLIVPPGSSVYVGDSIVHGSIAAQQPNVFTLCGSTVNGSFGVVAAMGPVTMAPVSTGCGANTVTSSNASLISSAGVNIAANQVGQKLLVWDARGPAASISANHVGGDLWCANDVPVPNNAGQPNVVTGSRIGQCGAASF